MDGAGKDREGSQFPLLPGSNLARPAASTPAQPFAFQSIFHSNFVANLVASGQTSEAIHSNVLANVQNLFFTVQETGGDVGGIVPLLQRLQTVHSNLFSQFFTNVDLELGTAFYIDCGATTEYTDALGRQWLPDAPSLRFAARKVSRVPGRCHSLPLPTERREPP